VEDDNDVDSRFGWICTCCRAIYNRPVLGWDWKSEIKLESNEFETTSKGIWKKTEEKRGKGEKSEDKRRAFTYRKGKRGADVLNTVD
jgi:hypothetical protein